MILVSRHSDRKRERRYHMAGSVALSGIALMLLGAPRSPVLSVVLFSAVALGAYSFLPVFFSLPGEFLTGFSAAAGIALATSVSNLGGFVGPYTVGIIRQRTGSSYYGLICSGFSSLYQRAWHCSCLSAPCLLLIDHQRRPT
jgi:predicted MFS family arabinose efflux permease